ncbi:MAG: hypothetical protein Q8898_09190 [Bacillota bacterium]|nr:hypothetical protein [Bacillota bacterium]
MRPERGFADRVHESSYCPPRKTVKQTPIVDKFDKFVDKAQEIVDKTLFIVDNGQEIVNKLPKIVDKI